MKEQTIVKLPPKRFRRRDLGTDRAKKYNSIHQTNIANNYMLDRFLRNREELRVIGIEMK